jgi:hypothetical protein
MQYWKSVHHDDSLSGFGSADQGSCNVVWLRRLKVYFGLEPAKRGPPPNPAPENPRDEPAMKAPLTKYTNRAKGVEEWFRLTTHVA